MVWYINTVSSVYSRETSVYMLILEQEEEEEEVEEEEEEEKVMLFLCKVESLVALNWHPL